MTYKMDLIRIVILITVSWTVDSLITVPRRIVAKLGDRVELECSTDKEDPVSWEFSPAGSHNNTFIYHCGIITYSLHDKYVIDNRETGRYNLIMNSVDLSFGGTYTCSDPDEQFALHVSSPSAELIVMVSDPACSTNSSAVVIKGDCINIVCAISYSGNWLPVMDCSKNSGQIIETQVYTRDSTVWTSSIMTQLTLNDNGVVFKCNTTFKSIHVPTNNRTTDEVISRDMVPPVYEYQYTWTFTAYVTDVATVTVADRGIFTWTKTDGGDQPSPTGISIARLAVVIGISVGALLLCLFIVIILYQTSKKVKSKRQEALAEIQRQPELNREGTTIANEHSQHQVTADQSFGNELSYEHLMDRSFSDQQYSRLHIYANDDSIERANANTNAEYANREFVELMQLTGEHFNNADN